MRSAAVRSVIDASALLALLFDEPGAETVADAIADGAAISAVNVSEVATVLVRRNLDADAILSPVSAQVLIESFAVVDALAAAALYTHTARSGLSLGDRACLALAKRLKTPAVTAEQAWSQLDVGIAVILIRVAAKR